LAARLLEQLVEPGPVLLGHLAANLGDLGLDLGCGRVLVSRAGDGCADRPQQCVGQLKRVAAGDVEPVEQPVSGELEIGRDRATGVAVERAQLAQHVRRITI